MIGFPSEKQFALLRHRDDSAIGWLQSTTNPALAFPVVSIAAPAVAYPAIAAEILLDGTTFSTNEPFVLQNLPPVAASEMQAQPHP